MPPIEDLVEDVLGKAMLGLGMSVGDVAARAGLDAAAVESLLSGQFDVTTVGPVAEVLNLNTRCLCQLAKGPLPPEIELPEGITLHNTPFPIPGYEEMTVNSYCLIPSEESGAAILIDAGDVFEGPLGRQSLSGALDWSLLLTHTHPDHVTHFRKLSKVASKAYAPFAEPYMGALPVREGDTFDFGSGRLCALETFGHSPGGTSYLLEGLNLPVVFVGDALFCYSIGKVREGYTSALSVIREKILSLPEETIICPGHGPITTVGFEKSHNPFFAT